MSPGEGSGRGDRGGGGGGGADKPRRDGEHARERSFSIALPGPDPDPGPDADPDPVPADGSAPAASATEAPRAERAPALPATETGFEIEIEIEGEDAARAESPARVPLARGAPIGRYVVLDLIGRGGMGVVYAAYDPQLDRKVAVKVLAAGADGPGGPARQRASARLLREAQALARLQHPHVVAVHDVGALGDDVFLAMEFIEGETLAEHLASARPGWRDVVRLFLDAGRGLAAAHAAGLVHRDFKPANALVGRDGRVRVLDFGLARAVLRDVRDGDADDAAEAAQDLDLDVDVDAHGSTGAAPVAGAGVPVDATVAALRLLSAPLTRAGARAGTLGYMAPEQLEGEDADPRSDQFAFCAALYEALCDGVPPFEGDDFASLLAAMRRGAPRRPPAGSPVLPGVFALLERGLAANPDDRHPELRPLLDQLAELSLRRRAADREAEQHQPASPVPAPVPVPVPVPGPGPASVRDTVAVAWARARLGRALLGAGRTREALEQLEPALAGLGSDDDPLRRARCCFDLARALVASAASDTGDAENGASSTRARAKAAHLLAEARRLLDAMALEPDGPGAVGVEESVASVRARGVRLRAALEAWERDTPRARVENG